MRSKFSFSSLICGFIGCIVALVFFGVILGLIALIPVVGWTIAIIGYITLFFWFIGSIFSTIISAFSYVVICEDHVKGRKGFKNFNLTYDKIDTIKEDGSEAMKIYLDNRKRTVYEIKHIKNLEDLMHEYRRVTKQPIEVEASEKKD